MQPLMKEHAQQLEDMMNVNHRNGVFIKGTPLPARHNLPPPATVPMQPPLIDTGGPDVAAMLLQGELYEE